jgi:hypothetical protein
MTNIKEYLMIKYCPNYLDEIPTTDDNKEYDAHAIVVYGYWGHKHKIVSTKRVTGIINAYKTARWLALKAQFYRPSFLFDCGINYAVRLVEID